MPTYTFRNTETNQEHSEFMTIAERESYLEANPQLQQVPHSPPILDSVRLGITKPDAAFSKYVLGRIKEKNPGSTIGSRHFDIPREW